MVVFFAGHGVLDKQLDYHFVTTDFDLKNPPARGLPYESIEGLLDGIPARHKLLMMDTCHSGEVDAEAVAPAGSTQARPPGRCTSSRAFAGCT